MSILKRLRLWWQKLLQKISSENKSELEELSYGIETAVKPVIMNFVAIFAWWCHEARNEMDASLRLLETKRTLATISNIGDCQSYYNSAPVEELRQLILDQLCLILKAEHRVAVLDKALLQLKSGSVIELLVLFRRVQLLQKE